MYNEADDLNIAFILTKLALMKALTDLWQMLNQRLPISSLLPKKKKKGKEELNLTKYTCKTTTKQQKGREKKQTIKRRQFIPVSVRKLVFVCTIVCLLVA